MPYADFLEGLKKNRVERSRIRRTHRYEPELDLQLRSHRGTSTHLALIAVLVVGISEMGGDYRRIMSRVERVRKKPRGSASRGRFGGRRQGKVSA